MASPSQIIALMRRHRRDVARLTEDFAKAHGGERRALARRVRGLAQQLVNDARREGIPVAELRRWLSSHDAYLALVEEAGLMMNRFVAIAVDAIREQVRTAAQLGAQHSALTVSEMVGAQFGVVNVEAVANLAAAFGPGSPLYQLQGIPDAQLEQVAELLIRGAASGAHPATIAGHVARLTDVPFWRANLIARTETFRAYREATLASYKENRAVGGWVWMANLPGACIACTAMHGSVHELDESMGSHPHCRCVMLPRLSREAWSLFDDVGEPDLETGDQWLAAQDADTQRSLLGADRLAQWKRGTPLAAFVQTSSSAAWGTTRTVAPLAA